MKVLNIGSLNYDYTYHVDHIIQPGETMDSTVCETFFGGKGFNQSAALSKAGLTVYHAGLLGADGRSFYDACESFGVNTQYIKMTEGKSGHAIIQIDKNGQNSIILFGGSNRKLTSEYIDSVLADFSSGDYLILQNEVNHLAYIIDKAYEKGMILVLNPSPYNDYIMECDLTKVSYFLLNEVEAYQISQKKDPTDIIETLSKKFPRAKIVLTLGSNGSVYYDGQNSYPQSIFPVKAIDTTAAGDTFTGYFIASIINKKAPEEALRIAAKASSIAVSRKGAAPSIPTMEEVLCEM